MEFKRTNLNPKEWKHEGDCVVRALAAANNMSWEKTYSLLCEIGLKKCRMPNSKYTYEQLLKNYDWIKYKMPKHSDGRRYTVKELADEKPNDRIVVSMANHLSFIDKGTLVDTWNCGNKSVGNYWIKSRSKEQIEKDLNDLAKDLFGFMSKRGVL